MTAIVLILFVPVEFINFPIHGIISNIILDFLIKKELKVNFDGIQVTFFSLKSSL